MKRITFYLMAASIVVALGLAPLPPSLAGPAQAQECTEATVMAKRGSWKEGSADLHFAADVVPKNREAALLSKIDVIRDMFREAVPQPLGVNAEGYKSIKRYGSEIPGGPATYGYISLYKTWLCNPTTHELELAGETGNWATVYINSLHYLVTEVGEMSIDGKPTMVYMLARRIGELRGHTLYEAWGPWGAQERAVLFTRGDRLPFTPITQRQYLDALELWWAAKLKAELEVLDEAIRVQEANLADLKRTLTGEMRDKIVAEGERALAEVRAQKPKSDARLSAAVAEEIEYIHKYRATHPAAELEKPAFLPEPLKMRFRGEFWEEAKEGHLLVQIDLSYFEKDLPSEAAHLVMLHWRWERDSVPSQNWRQTLEGGFPLEKLSALLAR
ncbi:MAG: hypothetical protein AB1649_22280 [Chloroflexota bacterium]